MDDANNNSNTSTNDRNINNPNIKLNHHLHNLDSALILGLSMPNIRVRHM